VRQVLVNLVINALEALNGRGSILLSLSFTNGEARIEVRDDGPGLSEKDPEALFDPFYSTKERGTGLGLAIARRIARAHGGELRAETLPGAGVCFTLTLPRNGKTA
jgi:signal transduction histidine kinase